MKNNIHKGFFIGFKPKEVYINGKIKKRNDIPLFKESFKEILSELDISDKI